MNEPKDAPLLSLLEPDHKRHNLQKADDEQIRFGAAQDVAEKQQRGKGKKLPQPPSAAQAKP